MWPRILVLLYVLTTYGTLPIARSILNSLESRGLVSIVVLSSTVVAMVGLGWLAKRTRLWQRPMHFLILVAGIAGLCIFSTTLPLWAERIHLVQYAGLGVLVGQAVPIDNWRRFPTVALIACAVGLGDEAIQYVLPERVFDWRDVGFNALAGTVGALADFLIHHAKATER